MLNAIQIKRSAAPYTLDTEIEAISGTLREAASMVKADGIQRLVLYVEPQKNLEEATADFNSILRRYGAALRTDYYKEHLLDPRETCQFKGKERASEAKAYTTVALIQIGDENGGMVPSFVNVRPDGGWVALNTCSPESETGSFPGGKIIYEISYRIPFTGRFLAPMVADNTTYCNLRLLFDLENANELHLVAKGLLQEGQGPENIRIAAQYAKEFYMTNLEGLMGGFSGLRFPKFPAGAS